MTVKTGLARQWRVHFTRHDGQPEKILFGSPTGALISKLWVLREARKRTGLNGKYTRYFTIEAVTEQTE